mmetsp:Transcript_60447/g.100318  ORF Transcript_60447/g.100318 Transcript_60447/m.100318 type:complete len:231 (-) Transcript_60447:503-1195(-)
MFRPSPRASLHPCDMGCNGNEARLISPSWPQCGYQRSDHSAGEDTQCKVLVARCCTPHSVSPSHASPLPSVQTPAHRLVDHTRANLQSRGSAVLVWVGFLLSLSLGPLYCAWCVSWYGPPHCASCALQYSQPYCVGASPAQPRATLCSVHQTRHAMGLKTTRVTGLQTRHTRGVQLLHRSCQSLFPWSRSSCCILPTLFVSLPVQHHKHLPDSHRPGHRSRSSRYILPKR